MKTAKIKKVTFPNWKHPRRWNQTLPLSTLLSLELCQTYCTYKMLVLVHSGTQWVAFTHSSAASATAQAPLAHIAATVQLAPTQVPLARATAATHTFPLTHVAAAVQMAPTQVPLTHAMTATALSLKLLLPSKSLPLRSLLLMPLPPLRYLSLMSLPLLKTLLLKNLKSWCHNHPLHQLLREGGPGIRVEGNSSQEKTGQWKTGQLEGSQLKGTNGGHQKVNLPNVLDQRVNGTCISFVMFIMAIIIRYECNENGEIAM